MLNSERTIMKHYYKYLLLLVVLVFSVHVVAQTTVWRDLHKVKKKETIFGIAKEYGVSIQELINANPKMKQEGYELKRVIGFLCLMQKVVIRNIQPKRKATQ